jgi:hypothetical protein
VTRREVPLDGNLPIEQPVEHGVDFVLGDAVDAELLAVRRDIPPAHGCELAVRLQDPRGILPPPCPKRIKGNT